MTQFENPVLPAYLSVDATGTSALRNINHQRTSFYIDNILASPSESSSASSPKSHGAISDDGLNEAGDLLRDSPLCTTINDRPDVEHTKHSQRSGEKCKENVQSRGSKQSSSSFKPQNPFFLNRFSEISQATPTVTSKFQWKLGDAHTHQSVTDPVDRSGVQATLPRHSFLQKNHHLLAEMLAYSKPFSLYNFAPEFSRLCKVQTDPYDSGFHSKAQASLASMLALYPFQNLKYDWPLEKQPYFTKGCSYMWDAVFRRGFNRRKGGQVRFSNNQTNDLEKVFVKQKYLSPPERKSIAKTLQLSERQVKTWFQNRRAKWRKLKRNGGKEQKSSDNFQNKKTNFVDVQLGSGVDNSMLAARHENMNNEKESVNVTACNNEQHDLVHCDIKQIETGMFCQSNVSSFSPLPASPKKTEANLARNFQRQSCSDPSADVILQRENRVQIPFE